MTSNVQGPSVQATKAARDLKGQDQQYRSVIISGCDLLVGTHERLLGEILLEAAPYSIDDPLIEQRLWRCRREWELARLLGKSGSVDELVEKAVALVGGYSDACRSIARALRRVHAQN